MPPPPTDSSIDRTAALYFLPSPDSYWRWSAAGDAAEWTADGNLIAFHEEIESVLRTLTPHGLPPFGAVLLFIAACRDTWGSGIARCASLQNSLTPEDLDLVWANTSPQWETQLADGLSKIHRLPEDLRRTTQAKTDLAAHLFELPHPDTPSQIALQIVESFANGLVAKLFARDAPEHEFVASLQSIRTSAISTARFIAALNALLAAFPNIDEASIRSRQATGLDSPPLPAPLAPEVTDTRSLIEQLQSDTDPDLRLLAEIARHLTAAVHLPKPPSTPDELPLGGFSDISNRGSLDRLLVSELALDDLALAVRIAMNEALYLRRESPPKSPARHRVILVDNGIRLWGIPRVFATAVALALSQNTGEGATVHSFSPLTNNQNPQPVDLADRGQLLAHLGHLTPHIHPALPWQSLLAQFPEAGHKSTDFILITHPESAIDHDFISASGPFLDRHFHLATVDISGAYALWACTQAGRQKIASAHIDLDEIVSTQSANSHRLRDDSNTELPVFYRLDQPPLRIAYPAASTLYLSGRIAVRPHTGEWVASPRDGRLLYWETSDKGARLLSAFAPSDDLLWLGIDPVLTSNTGPRWVGQLHLYKSPSGIGSSSIIEITHLTESGTSVARFAAEIDSSLGPPVHTHHTADHLALFWQRQTDVISLKNGTLLSRREHSHDLIKGSGPYVEFEGENWFRYTHTPQGIYFDRPTDNQSPLAAVWNHPGTEEPWAIAADGQPYPIGDIRSSAPIGTSPVFVSADGQRVVAGRSGTRTAYQFISGTYSPIPAKGDFLALIEPQIAKIVDRTPTIRRQFNAIAATPSGEFYLQSKRGPFTRISNSNSHFHLQNATRPDLTNVVPFESLHHVPDHLAALDLKVASFPDGTRAYLDRNAFLHLCPSDSTQPEITLVLLAQGAMPHWSSDELIISSPHPFFGGSTDSTSLLPHLQSVAQSAAAK